mgnify:CR=1 FL=1
MIFIKINWILFTFNVKLLNNDYSSNAISTGAERNESSPNFVYL